MIRSVTSDSEVSDGSNKSISFTHLKLALHEYVEASLSKATI